MPPRLLAIVGALSLVAGATPAVSGDPKGRIRHDDDHRYRLEITLARQSAVVGESLSTTFCRSPARDEKLEVCVGRFQGHWFFGGDRATSTFQLMPGGEFICTCERPVALLPDQPLCWPMDVSVHGVGSEQAEVGVVVTLRYGVRGGSASQVAWRHASSRTRPITD